MNDDFIPEDFDVITEDFDVEVFLDLLHWSWEDAQKGMLRPSNISTSLTVTQILMNPSGLCLPFHSRRRATQIQPFLQTSLWPLNTIAQVVMHKG